MEKKSFENKEYELGEWYVPNGEVIDTDWIRDKAVELIEMMRKHTLEKVEAMDENAYDAEDNYIGYYDYLNYQDAEENINTRPVLRHIANFLSLLSGSFDKTLYDMQEEMTEPL